MKERAISRAFTLVELLVVVTIVVVLVLLAMPAIERAGAAANVAVCASNLHQVHVALLDHATDRRGVLPDSTQNGGTWWWDISLDVRQQVVDAGATRGVFYCPSAAFQNADEVWNFNGSYAPIGYLWNLRQSTHHREPLLDGQPWVRLSDRNDLPLLADATLCNLSQNFSAVVGGWVGVHRTNHVQGGTFKYEIDRKPVGGNVLSGQGAVAWTPFDQMQPRTSASTSPQFWW